MRRTLLRLAGFSAGYALVTLLERVVIRVELAERYNVAELQKAADELEELRRRRLARCNCTRCTA